MAAKKLVYFIPLLFCLIAVFGLSSQPYGQQTVIPWLTRHVSPQRLAAWLPGMKFTYGGQLFWAKRMPYPFAEFLFRKGAHIFSYTLLGCSLFFCFRAFKALRTPLPVRFIGMAAGIGIVAALDEWNQTRVEMRIGQNVDVWLDFVGGSLGALIIILVAGRLTPPRSQAIQRKRRRSCDT